MSNICFLIGVWKKGLAASGISWICSVTLVFVLLVYICFGCLILLVDFLEELKGGSLLFTGCSSATSH